LLGVDRERRGRRRDACVLRRREQPEQLVWRDDEVGHTGLPCRERVRDELGGSPASGERLHEVLGDLAHEDVAVRADEHAAGHRPDGTRVTRRAAAQLVPLPFDHMDAGTSPRVSVVTPVFDPPLGAFLACAESLRRQTFTEWEWCVVDDCSTRPEIAAALDELATDPRISVRRRSRNGGIVAATNDALALASGEFVALLDHDDTITPTALERVFAALDDPAAHDVDYVYTDEAHVLADGREAAHFLKPGWSPERFRSSMYTCHLSLLRLSLVEGARWVPHRVRRLAGPRPHPAGDGGDRAAVSGGSAPPVPRLPLAQHRHLGLTGDDHAVGGDRQRSTCRAGAVHSPRASTQRSSTGRSAARTGSCAACRAR
jgi:hypothetical protein